MDNFSGPVQIPAEIIEEQSADDDILTPQRARAARTKGDQGYWFRLPDTGGKALVRRISSNERLTIASLPQHQQQRVLIALNKIGNQTNAVRDDGSVMLGQWQRNAAQEEDICNAYCVAGFLKPRLIFSEAERTDDLQVVVSDLSGWERKVFFLWSEMHSDIAARFFRPVADEAGEPPESLEVGRSGGVLIDAPFQTAQPEKGAKAARATRA